MKHAFQFRPRYFYIIGLAIVFAVIGVVLIIHSRAATTAITVEPELGSVSAPATTSNDPAASGGKAVRFAAAGTTNLVSAANPCVRAAAPTSWKHVVVLMFENKVFSNVIGSANAPYISNLASKCGTYANWKDANIRADGTADGSYPSKPNYATLTSGVPPSVHGIKTNAYSTTTSVDNIFNRLRLAGKTTKSYVAGTGASCSQSNFSGAYHDPLRYYTNLGGQSSASTTFCNQNDIPIGRFMTDVNSGNLPAFSMVIPTNTQNMHDNSISSGDAWAKTFLDPFLNSAQYKSGDTAVFFLWDEDTPIPVVLMAPSVRPGSRPVMAAGSNPIGHYSALRTWQEMLGLSPLLGNTSQAPSLLTYMNGQ